MADIQSTPITEFIGVSNSTHTDGLKSGLEVYVPDFVPWDKCCPDQTKIFPVGAPKMWQCPGGSHEITKKKVIAASFLGANNGLIPCIHKGERVRIINYGGDEHYFWMPLGRDPGLRRHETIEWYAMSQPKAVTGEDMYEDVTDDNTYFIRFNTNPGEKHVRLHTNKLEGEYRCYDFVIKPEDGEVWLFDSPDGKIGSRKNWLCLKSKEHLWHWENEDGSYAELNKENINVFCKDTYTLHAMKHVIINADVDYVRTSPTQTCQGNDLIHTFKKSHTTVAATISETASGAMSLKAATINYNGTHTFIGPNFTCSTSHGIFSMPYETHLIAHIHQW